MLARERPVLGLDKAGLLNRCTSKELARVNEFTPTADFSPPFEGEDYALLQGIAARNPKALATLYDRRGGLLFALCLRVLKDRMAAEEALEDVFWEVWNKSDRFDANRGTPINYLLNLTQSRAIDKLRSRAKLKRLELATDRDAGDRGGRDITGPTLDHVTPADIAEDAERRESIRRAVGQLNEDQRQAVEMAFFDGLTHSEIAEKLSIPLGTIKTRIRQGLVHLKDALGNRLGKSSSEGLQDKASG